MMAWGITIPKTQGLTLDKVVVELGKKNFSAGLSFVAISWVKTLQGLAFCTHFDYSYLKSQATESMLMFSNRYIYNEHHNQLGSNRFSIWPMSLKTPPVQHSDQSSDKYCLKRQSVWKTQTHDGLLHEELNDMLMVCLNTWGCLPHVAIGQKHQKG